MPEDDAVDSKLAGESEAPSMRIYIFKSETRRDLRAFGGDLIGSRLPKQFQPWRAVGAIGPSQKPPHKLSRDVIERAIRENGFQLWRLSKKAAND